MTNSNENKILYKDLSYKLQGLFYNIRNDLGSGHKESIYQRALEKELQTAGITFQKEPAIKIYSAKKEYLGLYRPDFIIEDKIIIELKAVQFITKQEQARVYDYLRNSNYELAYLVNFASLKIYIKRIIFTNDRKNWLKYHLIVALFVAICFVFVAISGVSAAELSFEAQEPTIGSEGDFWVAVNLSAVEPVNAFQAAIKISPAAAPEEVMDANSITSLWVDKPHWDEQGRVFSFSGIIPGGFTGQEATLLVINLKADGVGRAGLSFVTADTKVWLNTPDGIEDTVLLASLSLPVVKGKENIPVEPPDYTPPDTFRPEVARVEGMFDGQYFAVFSARDKGIGIASYFIAEQAGREIVAENYDRLNWREAESPYVLQDQTLASYIYIKAVDKAGHERVEVIAPQNPRLWYVFYFKHVIISVIIVLVGYWIWQKVRRRKKKIMKNGGGWR